MFKRITALFLSVVLAIGISPAAAFADNATAFSAANETPLPETAFAGALIPSPISIGDAAPALSQISYVYDGMPKMPLVTAAFNGTSLIEGVDFSVSYEDNVHAGEASATVVGIGAFTGTQTLTFVIRPASMAKASITKPGAKTYTGAKYRPKPTVRLSGKKLKLGRDYTIAYVSNKNAGKAYLYVRGKGDYQGTRTVRFSITRAALSSARLSSVATQKYTGNAIQPRPSVSLRGKRLKLGRDYVLSYRNNVSAGTAKVIASGRGNYKGTRAATFKIANPAPVQAPGAGVASADVYITRTGEKYHRSWCSSLRYSRIRISRAEARAYGYEPCKICHPDA